MIMELESRLIKSENRFYAQYLLPRVIGNRSVSAKTRRTDFGQFLSKFCLTNHEINVLLMYSIYP